MRKVFIFFSISLIASLVSAQTWTELPVVTNDYTSYSTAKIQVNPVTQRPSVGFKGRKKVATDTNFNKGLVYEYIDGQWKQIAVSTDNVNSTVFNYQISPASSGVSHGYMAYYDDDSAKVRSNGLMVERIFRGAPTYQLGENGTTAPRVWYNDTIGQVGDFIKLPAAASYMGFNVITDYRATKCIVTAASDRTERSAVYNYPTNTWTVDTVAPVKSIQTYKSVQTMSPDGSIYVMSMLRGEPYAITVSKYMNGEWTNLEFPNAAKNAALYPVFDITTDKDGNVYTLSADAQDGISNNAYVRKYDAVAKTWSYVGGESKSLFKLSDSHIRLDFVVMDDSTLVVAYSDPTDEVNPYAVRTLTCDLKTNTWGEPEILPGVSASAIGDLTVAKSAAGDLYIAYVDNESKIRVMHRAAVDNKIFTGLVCDTINPATLKIPHSLGAAKQSYYIGNNTGVKYHFASYSYNSVDKDTLGTTIFCDTIQAGFALSKASKIRDGVNPGFVVTANPNHAIKSMRIYWYVIASNIGREMDIYTSETPYEICSDLVDPTKQGTKVATVVENAEGYTDVTFEGNVQFFGFNTNSTGLFIRNIVIGYQNLDDITPKTIEIKDGTTYERNISTRTNVEYTRTFNNTSWQALYVPFSMKYEDFGDKLEIAWLNNVHMYDDNEDDVPDRTMLEFYIMHNGAIEPNTPYLVRAKNVGTFEISLKDVTLAPAETNPFECSTFTKTFTVRGTYDGVTGTEMYENHYYAPVGGKLTFASSTNASLKPQRWYLKVANKNGSPVTEYAPAIRMCIDGVMIEEEEATSIDLIDSKSSATYYTLDGRKLSTKPSKSGLYLLNNKKALVK